MMNGPGKISEYVLTYKFRYQCLSVCHKPRQDCSFFQKGGGWSCEYPQIPSPIQTRSSNVHNCSMSCSKDKF
ncbi:hypothetical protein XELAEV_18037979mg [Xenopus laevis]|uniref:Uncharacterized protein n=1 Tax=Xenopus laevis TaxID=8355 RepID=A0A974CEC3_XENLA|nr:hypothetical protein XELAEV_18037979mg [Xenopus laevis]